MGKGKSRKKRLTHKKLNRNKLFKRNISKEKRPLQNVRPIFKFVKMLDHGVSNPIVNRLSLQFFEMFQKNLLDIPEPDADKIKGCLLGCMKDLLKAQEAQQSYLQEEDQAIQRIMSGKGINLQPHAFSYDDPTEKLKKYLEVFLIRCVIAIRKIAKIGSIVFSKRIDGSKELKRYLGTIFPKTSPEMNMVEKDSIWIKELYDLRGSTEHDELQMEPFNVAISDKGQALIRLPMLDKQKLVRDYIKVTLENCFTFCEDISAIMLNTRCLEGSRIIQVPKDLRDKYRGFKYVLDYKGLIQAGFIKSVRGKDTTSKSEDKEK
jgi:hypothetical protein